MTGAPGPYTRVANAFDAVAATYDENYGTAGNPVMAWMRRENLAVLKATFPPGSRLLEVGCGTGEDAIALARDGRSIVATDVSPGMVEQARSKVAAAGVGAAVSVRVAPAARVADLAPEGPFDGAYASFGVLNVEHALDGLVDGLGGLLPPGAPFVTSLMSPFCLWEMAWFGLRLQPRRALRRWRRWAPSPVGGGHHVPTRFYSAATIAARFRPAFRVERRLALPLLLPPPYLDALYRRHRSFFGGLERAERGLRDRFPLYALGDHFLMVLRRV